ncbi:DUF1648 domain-containing protein [Microbacterium candidum]|uniref:DUF1648 domain-containing protein n=1 Tax=Microbacterium candidum TaxID=3041922 RepID=A0ABT7N1X9_9MICO|nr:DUF1648 domain-containing protein [Microbacterium sp. ASV49]MDL9980719.1 DUF1648 domain-containing protein [Microbacterium sp. ASV49]
MTAEGTARSDRTPPRDRAVSRFVIVALVLPLLLTVVSVVVQLLLMPSMPDPVATHWGPGGAPNGFGSAWVSPVLTVVLGLLLPGLIAITVLPGLRRGHRGAAYRLLGAMALALAVLAAVLMTWTYAMQAGLASAKDGPSATVPLIVSFAASVLAGFAGWFLQPKQEEAGAASLPSAPVALAPGERAVWMQTTTSSRPAVIAITAAVLLTAALTIWIAFTGEARAAWILGIVTVILIAAAASTLSFNLRVDDTGLTVTSVVGIPRFHVPLADITAARATTVTPMADFGGWGIRYLPGRFGVVLRTGPAIEVARTSGRLFVVTAPDAATGAALLTAFADRATSTESPEKEVRS